MIDPKATGLSDVYFLKFQKCSRQIFLRWAAPHSFEIGWRPSKAAYNARCWLVLLVLVLSEDLEDSCIR